MIIHPIASRSRRLGLQGLGHADRLATALGRRLDDGYHWFRRIAAGSAERIDVVVVGTGGTWTIVRSNERGRYHRRNGHWYRWSRGTESWIPWEAAPVTAARLAGRRLSLYLERAALPAAVEAVLMPPADTEMSREPGEQIGVHVEASAERLAERITRDDVLSPAQVDRIVALLDPRQPLPRLAPSAPNG